MVGADVLGGHAAEELVGLVGAAARAAGRHQRRVGDHVGGAGAVVLGSRLHVREHLHAFDFGDFDSQSLDWETDVTCAMPALKTCYL